jgi:hypothetical protein
LPAAGFANVGSAAWQFRCGADSGRHPLCDDGDWVECNRKML